MTILFLHGWNSVPGGVKPTYLKAHGHEVINPALPHEDSSEAVRIAQADPQIEYELLVENPYTFTQQELLFAVHVRRQGIGESELTSRRPALWEEFFGNPRACLRASMLPKKYGWGLHFDAEGRIALVAVGSEEYRGFVGGKGVATVLTAMRNKRA
jgi:hypothetical protein